MSHFFAPPQNVQRDKIFIEGGEAHHLLQVMRLKLGDEVTIFDGQGNEYQGVIIEQGKRGAIVKILDKKQMESEKGPNITLAQAIPARGKMDYLVEKTTELGIDRIIPLETERSVVKMSKAKTEVARQRWERIAISASKQCGRLRLPVISQITQFPQVLEKVSEFDLILFPCLSAEARPLKKILRDKNKPKNILVFIGPEGDFSPEEISQAKLSGCHLARLGSNILKSDTAALMVLSVLKYAYNAL